MSLTHLYIAEDKKKNIIITDDQSKLPLEDNILRSWIFTFNGKVNFLVDLPRPNLDDEESEHYALERLEKIFGPPGVIETS